MTLDPARSPVLCGPQNPVEGMLDLMPGDLLLQPPGQPSGLFGQSWTCQGPRLRQPDFWTHPVTTNRGQNSQN